MAYLFPGFKFYWKKKHTKKLGVYMYSVSRILHNIDNITLTTSSKDILQMAYLFPVVRFYWTPTPQKNKEKKTGSLHVCCKDVAEGSSYSYWISLILSRVIARLSSYLSFWLMCCQGNMLFTIINYKSHKHLG